MSELASESSDTVPAGETERLAVSQVSDKEAA
jgi:hypothetical protein